MYQQTLGVILINETVLSGKKRLQSVLDELEFPNWKVKKLSVIPRNENLIYFEIDCMYKLYDAVVVVECDKDNDVKFSLYGILAKLFHQELVDNGEINSRKSGSIIVPKFAKILENFERVNSGFPVIHLQRVFIVNSNAIGASLDVLKAYLKDSKFPKVFEKEFSITLNGTPLVDFLGTKNEVHVSLEKTGEITKLRLKSTNFNSLFNYEKYLTEQFGSRILGTNPTDISLFNTLFHSVDYSLKEAITIIREAIEQYGPENIFLSFNGGKDCTVLLHLTLSILKKYYPNYKKPVVCWYARSTDAFPEQDNFITQCKQFYNLHIIVDTTNIKTALENILSKMPHLKACLMGTRRTDPYSLRLDSFQMTDSDWPQIMRVLPLLDWHYSYIWDYLLYFVVPYCSLYDVGYTSLGNVKNTVRNPSLSTYSVLEGKEIFLPAYKLLDAEKERYGRHG